MQLVRVLPFLQGLLNVKNSSTSSNSRVVEDDINLDQVASLSAILNKSALLIQINHCNRTEYLCGDNLMCG